MIIRICNVNEHLELMIYDNMQLSESWKWFYSRIYCGKGIVRSPQLRKCVLISAKHSQAASTQLAPIVSSLAEIVPREIGVGV